MKKTHSVIIWVGLILPALLSLGFYCALRLQPERSWRMLMPSQDFAAPQRGLKILVLTADDVRSWDRLMETTYFYPKGGYQWLVLKEGLRSRARGNTGDGLATAVDAKGNFFNYRGSRPDEEITFSALNKPSDELSEYLQSATLIAENPEVLGKMRDRLEILRNKTDVLFLTDTNNPLENPSVTYGTELKVSSALRMLPFVGAFFCLALSLWIYFASQPLLLRLGLALLALPLYYTCLQIMFRAANFIPPPIPMYGVPTVLWILSIFTLAKTMKRPPTLPWNRSNINWTHVALAISLSVVALTIFRGFLSASLSTGDSCALTFLSNMIYDRGEWRYREFLSNLELFHQGNYPQGVGVLLSYLLSIVGPDVFRIYFPGHETGAVWILFGLIAIAFQVTFVVVTAGTLRIVFGKQSALQTIFLVLFALFVPSVVGKLHASEIFHWPLFGSVVVLLVAYAKTKDRGIWWLSVVLAAGLFYTKRDASLQFVLLILPFMLYAEFSTGKSYVEAAKRGIYAAVAILLLLTPLIAHQIEATPLHLPSPGFVPFQLTSLKAQLNQYPYVISETTRLFLSKSDVRFVEYALQLVLGIGLYFILSGLAFSGWKIWLVPIAIIAFITVLPLMYLFSVYPNVHLHIATSWGRVVVPVYATLLAWFCLAITENGRPT